MMPLIQDVFKKYGGLYFNRYGKHMPPLHKKALYAIINCRTKKLGGEVYFCAKCSEYHYSYHSCQNRHCVVCQNDDAGEWIERQKKRMLPFTYFLATFTMPEELRNPCRSNQRLFYSILFKASSEALKLLARDKKYLGAVIGMTGILHTWSRALVYHPHVHYLIPGGGISNDGKTAGTEPVECIRFSGDDFLMHVKPLSIIFRAKFRDSLKKQAPDIFNKIPAETWKRGWVVHIKPVGDGEKALEYMGRYLFRVAISNNRIIKLETGKVTFRYTENKTGKTRIITLDALEFIRRFLQHVLPHNFMKVRYYGYLAAASGKKLSKLRKRLFVDLVPDQQNESDLNLSKVLVCPKCGGPLQWVEKLPKGISDHVP